MIGKLAKCHFEHKHIHVCIYVYNIVSEGNDVLRLEYYLFNEYT